MDLNGAVEKSGQVLFRDNGNILFRQIEVSEASLLEKKNGVVVKGWRHFFKTQFPVEKFGGVPGGMYTLSHERDIVWDPFNILSKEEKPEVDMSKGMFNRKGIREVAQSKCYKHEHQKPPSSTLDKITWVLLTFVSLAGIIILYRWAV